MKANIYVQRRKNPHHTDAMLSGFPFPAHDLANGIAGGTDTVHILGGLQYGALEAMRTILSEGLPFVFYDRAYFGGGSKTDRLRITANDYQQTWVQSHTERRAARWGVRLSPWRTSGSHVLLVPPSDALKALFGLPADWEDEIQQRLKGYTDRPVRVSRKGDPVPLAERLRDCWAVVTWTSNVAVEAIVAGVPAITSRWSAAFPVADYLGNIESKIESPSLLDRDDWLESLAWGQFTLDEIRSGLARAVVMQAFEGVTA